MELIKRIGLAVLVSIFAVGLSGCASSGGVNLGKSQKMHEQILKKQFTQAKLQLNTLYSAFPRSHQSEVKFQQQISGVVQYVPEKNEDALLEFFDIYRGINSVRYLESVYYFRKGQLARGAKSAKDTPRASMRNMQSNYAKAIIGFRSVLENDPGNYLAHMYLGSMHAYQSADRESERQFRNALAINPASRSVWDGYLNFNLPRWGGSYEKMERLIEEMKAYEGRNRRLRNLRGFVLIDKGENAVRAKKYTEAEDLIFRAWDFAPYRRYGRTVDYLYREVRNSGDARGGCRIARKVHDLVPKNARYQKYSQACDAAGL